MEESHFLSLRQFAVIQMKNISHIDHSVAAQAYCVSLCVGYFGRLIIY